MSDAGSEDRLKALRPFLDFIPPKCNPKALPPPRESPISFENRDLDMGLSLKRVISLPNLLSILLEFGAQALPFIEKSGIAESEGSSVVEPWPVDPDVDIRSVKGTARKYEYAISQASIAISSFFVHRDTGDWTRVAFLLERTIPRPVFSCSEFAVALDDMTLDTSARRYRFVKPEYIERLNDMWKYTPNLIAFQFLRPSHDAVDIVKGIRPANRFDWVSHSTNGLSCTSIPPEELHDATDNLWADSIEEHSLRRSARLRATAKSPPNTTRSPRLRPGKPVKQDAPYVINPRDFVQELWSHAARRDVSWLVFHCGSHERIGLRHRQTQTLYISDLIEIPGNKEYSKIHLGLYLATMYDAIQRIQIFNEHEESLVPVPRRTKRQTKRKRSDADRENLAPSKKRKLGDESLQKLENCNWILVSSKYDKFNSPAPAFFVRCNLANENPTDISVRDVKSSYPLKGSIELRLSQPIGSGAIGRVHGAHIISHENPTKEIPPDSSKFVVKLAFSPQDRKRLLHEATIYARLTERETKYIPRFFGCFRNIEGDALALVLEHGGTSLGSTPKFQVTRQGSDDQVRQTNTISVPEPLNGKIKTALQSVHDADVLHRDIRKWNILIDKDDNPMIIDFDRAKFRSSVSQKEREMERLDALLDGIFQDGVAGDESSRSTVQQTYPVTHDEFDGYDSPQSSGSSLGMGDISQYLS